MPPFAPPAILDHHRKNNRASAAGWDLFAGHRDRVTGLVREGAEGRLLVLGAGNCNDLELGALASDFSEIHLADLDVDAVGRARARQSPDVAAKLVLHTPVDFSGAYATLPAWKSRSIGSDELLALPTVALERTLAALPRDFDVVVSACCLSQIMHSCFLALGRHPQLEAIAGALARVHVRALLSLARPGGRVLLVSDVVSTETFPLLELWGQRSPLAMLAEIEQAGNFLSGTAPSFIRKLFMTDEVAAGLIAGPPTLVAPWLWHLGDDMSFLVYALQARRRALP